MHYSTLHEVRAYLRLTGTETADDDLLTFFIGGSVRAIDEYTRRRFDVRLETRSFDYPFPKRDLMGVYDVEMWVYQMNAAADYSKQRLRMDDDLLEVVTLTNGNGVEIDSSDYYLSPANMYPKHAVRLVSGSGVTWQYGENGETAQVIDVEGYWGRHRRYERAWVDSGDDVQNDPLAIAETVLEVSDYSGATADLESPRFQVGQMLKIGSEFVFVQSINTVDNELTIERGYNGTTAVEHVQGTAIYVYRPEQNIRLACSRLAAWRYRQKDVDTFDKSAILGSGIAIIPSTMPADVRELLPFPKEPGQGLK